MARFPRAVVPGTPLHLIQRGNNRSDTFVAAEDYSRYRAVLREASQRYGCGIHAYVLMTNHVHLLITPRDESGPRRMMQAVGSTYVRYFNARYKRTGTLWEGRFRSALVDSERYLLSCSRYIELNPVRARMVEHPSQYRWSSYRRNAHGDPDTLVTQHPVYQALDSASAMRLGAYRALFEGQLDANAIDAIRLATNRGTALGDEPFCADVEATLKRPITRLCHGGDRHSQGFKASSASRGQSR